MNGPITFTAQALNCSPQSPPERLYWQAVQAEGGCPGVPLHPSTCAQTFPGEQLLFHLR